ncbi:hypothetical protein D3C72_1175900 [compost metagenome]
MAVHALGGQRTVVDQQAATGHGPGSGSGIDQVTGTVDTDRAVFERNVGGFGAYTANVVAGGRDVQPTGVDLRAIQRMQHRRSGGAGCRVGGVEGAVGQGDFTSAFGTGTAGRGTTGVDGDVSGADAAGTFGFEAVADGGTTGRARAGDGSAIAQDDAGTVFGVHSDGALGQGADITTAEVDKAACRRCQ